MAVKKQDEFQQNPYANAVVRQTMPNTQIPNMDWNAQKADLYRQISDRQPFEFDLDKEALYQQLKDQYTRLGQQAMKDTMGQAAGLTGGYSSSYAQNVGQQAYDDHLTKLNAAVPELYAQARAAYDAEGDDLYRQFQLAAAAADDAYQKERDALSDERWQMQWDYGKERDAADDAWKQQQWEYSKERDAASDAWQREQWEYSKGQDAMSNAQNYARYLLQMGIMPSDEQLAAAGISPQEAASIRNYYNAQIAGAYSGGSGSGGSGGGGGRGKGTGDWTGDGSGVGDGELQTIPTSELAQYVHMLATGGNPTEMLNALESAYDKTKYDTNAAWAWIIDMYKRQRNAGGPGGGTIRPRPISLDMPS